MELEDNKRRRRISEAEEAALLAVASPHLRSMIITALDTGMRRGEMLALRFSDIDWKRRLITLRGATTKGRKTRVVPIGSYKDLTLECQQRLREIDLHWHDLRHEYASRLVERGVPLAQVRDLLGHASTCARQKFPYFSRSGWAGENHPSERGFGNRC